MTTRKNTKKREMISVKHPTRTGVIQPAHIAVHTDEMIRHCNAFLRGRGLPVHSFKPHN